MGIDASEVHIIGILQLWNVSMNKPLEKTAPVTVCFDCIYPSDGPNYQITARVDHFTLTIDYQQNYWGWPYRCPYEPGTPILHDAPIEIDPNGQLIGPIWMPPYYGFPTMTLTSFIDKAVSSQLKFLPTPML